MSINQLTNLSKNLRSTSIILIIGISLSLFLLSCGSGIDPQLKVNNPEAGQCGIDLTLAPSDTGAFNEFGYVSLAKASPENLLNKEITVEAWVKQISAGAVEGSLYFNGGDHEGIALYIRQNVPRFVLRVADVNTVANNGFIDASARLNQSGDVGNWHHIAGVLSNGHTTEDHVGVGTSTCSNIIRTGQHLDLYFKGQLVDCVAVPAAPSQTHLDGGRLGGPLTDYGLGIKAPMEKMHFDEVRVWSVARTKAEIQQCMNAELSVSGGNCSINSNILIGYWKFNECSGLATADHSGFGASGSVAYCDTDCFGPAATSIDWINDNIRISGYPFP